MTTNQQTIQQSALKDLLCRMARLNREGEHGFETAAEHIKNRGLKILLKTYARQRAQFAADLTRQAEQFGANPNQRHGPLSSIRSMQAAIHRGWIDIKAAMTIGRENTELVVLSEGQRAESGIVVHEYQKALQMALPDDVQDLIQCQYQEIQGVHEQLALLADRGERRLLVQLYDRPAEAQQAVDQMVRNGVSYGQIRLRPLDEVMQHYECNCHGSRVMEGASAGIVSGGILGAVIGFLAGVSGLFEAETMIQMTTITTVAGMGFGALSGSIFGAIIGQSTAEEDAFAYAESVAQGSTLVMVEVESAAVQETRAIIREHRSSERQYALGAV